jgi:hypothetical protein
VVQISAKQYARFGYNRDRLHSFRYRQLAEQSDFPSAAQHCEASLALLQQRYGTSSVSAEIGREQLKCATLHFAVRFSVIVTHYIKCIDSAL